MVASVIWMLGSLQCAVSRQGRPDSRVTGCPTSRGGLVNSHSDELLQLRFNEDSASRFWFRQRAWHRMDMNIST